VTLTGNQPPWPPAWRCCRAEGVAADPCSSQGEAGISGELGADAPSSARSRARARPKSSWTKAS